MEIKIKEQAKDGEANKGLIDFLAKNVFQISKSDIEIVKGQKNREKIIKVSGLEINEAYEILNKFM